MSWFRILNRHLTHECIYIYIYAHGRGCIVLMNNSAQLQWMLLILNYAQLETLVQEIVNGYRSERNTAEGSGACSGTGLGQSACYVQWTGSPYSTGTTIHASWGAGLAGTSLSRRWNYWSRLWGKIEPGILLKQVSLQNVIQQHPDKPLILLLGMPDVTGTLSHREPASAGN